MKGDRDIVIVRSFLRRMRLQPLFGHLLFDLSATPIRSSVISVAGRMRCIPTVTPLKPNQGTINNANGVLEEVIQGPAERTCWASS